ncbi:M15 family metallopeptidase [Microbacterium caowuchunii]|uniref:M15 family metallopeptidase n=1 Tax=Microbacterium caowuchunii TaxID=2614638 RepID=A0A5N0TL08_9MICO|nr:M15 family metallopeptidase [Microbacterium caowuchunii]KAA9135835.1 M15 family metallopeptidase [Microbacterium caowuchunii]
MSHTVLPPFRDERPTRVRRRITFVALGVCLAALVAALATVLAGLAGAALASSVAGDPDRSGGLVASGSPLQVTEVDEPALAGLDARLRDALAEAAADAAEQGIEIRVTSGWRSEAYQRRLMEDAIRTHGSEAEARRYVAPPEQSRHVTGDAVDLAPVDAQYWLIQYGDAYGLCQIYANESWHFELATTPGGVCPELREDASDGRAPATG